MKFLDIVERFVARWRPRRNTDQIELLMEPSRMCCGAITITDAFRSAAQQNAKRMVLAWHAVAIEVVVDNRIGLHHSLIDNDFAGHGHK